MKGLTTILLLTVFATFWEKSFGQEYNKLIFDGQVSAYANYNRDSKLNFSTGGRYIPQLNYALKLDSTVVLDFEASANIYGSFDFHAFDSSYTDGNIQPYRIWTRITGRQYEVRVGLQKIDFGSSTLLRPLQWFNQIDPRDPLKLTYGVYGALGRYYFLNNANVWFWVLAGNEKTRGFDAVKTYRKHPEFGGRVQYPVSRGELAVSYHHRTSNAAELLDSPLYEKVPEDRVGIDGKWDLGVGLWFETSFTHKYKQLDQLTNQSLFNLGTDYTFGIGSGLNVVVEHLTMSFDSQVLRFSNTTNITATNISYPLGLFDTISAVYYYNWTTTDYNVFINYSHSFRKVTGYLMAYYNSGSPQGIQENELVQSPTGPGIRLLLVYNH
ncbi:MAG: hypothetical protein RIF36_16645 [Imperialibacter sp.]|uniref:hypothetical protein n=1 Tax=Imperialibacter sp. TaxID=2038411 RepID=UPI0032EE3E22